MASLATHDEWVVARDLLIKLIKVDMKQNKVIESNFINNYLGDYCDFGQPAHWSSDDMSTNGMEGNYKLIKNELPAMHHIHCNDLMATVGSISIRQQTIDAKTFHHDPVHLPAYWNSLPIVANRSTVTFDYATAVFYDYGCDGNLVDKENIPRVMNSSSHIVVYIPTKKLHNNVFDKTTIFLSNGEASDDERSHREVVHDVKYASKNKSSIGRNLQYQTSTFLKEYETLMYKELYYHTVDARKDEDVFEYLNRRVHRDNILAKD